MKKELLLLLSLLFALQSFSQEHYFNVSNISMYHALDSYIEDQNIANPLFESKAYTITNSMLALGYTRTNGRFSQEISLMPLKYQYSNSELAFHYDNGGFQIYGGEELYQFKSMLDYKISYLLRASSKRFVPSFGLGGLFFNEYQNFSPKVSNRFARQINFFAFFVQANLGMSIKLMDRLKLNIQIPIMLFETSILWQKNDNQTYKESDRSIRNNTNQFLPHFYQLRLGLSYRLGGE